MVIGCHNNFVCLVKIVGLDYCGLMIAAARKLQSGNAVEYSENQVAQIPLGEGVDHRQVQLQFVQVCYVLYHKLCDNWETLACNTTFNG